VSATDVLTMVWREPRTQGPRLPESYWRSLTYFNLYRLVAAFVLAGLLRYLSGYVGIGLEHRPFFFRVCVLSALAAVLGLIYTGLRRPRFQWQLGFDLLTDILLVTLLIYASGGVGNGLELMLLVTLAAAGMISRGRLALFYASLATIAVLIEETLQYVNGRGNAPQFLLTGLLSVGYFAVAWLAHTLAQYTRESEQLAAQRGVDLANMAQVNELILKDMADGVIVVDEQGRIRSRNAKTEELLGPLPMLAEIKLKDYSLELSEWLSGWRANPTNRFMVMRSPAAVNQMRVRFVPIGDREDQGTVIFLDDLVQEQNQARQLKLAALGRLTGSIAHEIRNPLSSISHATELMEEMDIDATGKKLLRIIRDNTARLNGMVRDVLDLNRSDRAKPEPLEAKAYLAGFVEELLQTERTQPEVFSLELNVEGRLYFDPNHLHQILWNLTRNALRHSKKQAGSVRICLNRSPQPEMLQLDVMDDGPGVPADMVGKLFEPFFTTESQGTGLGLYIARELAEANGAALDYVELSPGAHFRILIRSQP
jgi:two-component system, NtrC family, sensor histidine kinase PilS